MERYFTGVPGLKVVAVSNAYDAMGILKAAVRDDNPVLIFEHQLLYGSKGARTESGAVDATSEIPDQDYVVPLDQAAVRRSGSEVTILSWLLRLHFSLDAAQQVAGKGVDAEVIDVRSLAPIDYRTIGDSVKKTGRVVIVEEGPKTGGVSAKSRPGFKNDLGGTSRAQLSESLRPISPYPSLRFLKMPIARVCGKSSKRCENWFGRSLTLPEAASRLTLLRNLSQQVMRF
jgi:hypothetical protein